MKNTIKTIIYIAALALTSACSNDESKNTNTNSPQIFQISDGLQVSLIAPNDFNITTEHYGFAQAESFSRIRISEKEHPYIPYVKSLSKENLLKNKLQLINQEEIDIAGAICSLFTLRQNIAGTFFEKLWLVSGDDLSSIQIEASYPEGSSTTHKDAIKQSLLTLSVASDKSKRIFTGLPFMLTDTGNFKIKQRFINSILLIPTENNDSSTSIVISHGNTAKAVEDIQTLSEHFLNNSKTHKNVDILTNEMIKLDNIPALATTADVQVNEMDAQIYQVVSYQKERFLLVQAQSSRSKSEELKKDVENILAHFKFK